MRAYDDGTPQINNLKNQNMQNQILLKIKKTGFAQNQLTYPFCEKSKILAEIFGQKTFTRDNLEKIKALGFAILYK